MANADPVTHDDLIAKNRRTSMMMLAVEFLLVGALGGAIGLLITRSPVAGVAVGAGVAVFVDLIGWLVAVRATIALTHAVETTPEQAKVLHDVVEGLCIRTGLPKPKVYIVDDPAPNAFAFGRSPEHSGLAVTSGLLNLMSRRELEGVLAHEMSHIRNRDVQVTTLAVTTVGLLVAVADISARASWFADWGDNNDSGGLLLIAVAAVAGVLAFGARLLSLAISRHREELADTSAAAIVSPDGLRRALEKLEADHTVLHHVSRGDGAPLAGRAAAHRGQRARTRAATGCSTRTRRSTSASRSCASSKASTRTGAVRSTRPAPACPSTSPSSRRRPSSARNGVRARKRRRSRRRPLRPAHRRRAQPISPEPLGPRVPATQRVTDRAGTTPTQERSATGTARAGPTGPRSGTGGAGCSRATR